MREREIIKSSEIWDESHDKFEGTIVIYREAGCLYRAVTTKRAGKSEVGNLVGKRIPSEVYKYPLPRNIPKPLIAPRPLPEGCYVKRVDIGKYDPDDIRTHSLARSLVEEVRVYEILREAKGSPHPNICEYVGCVVDADNRVEGIALRKYSHTLLSAGYHGKRADPDKVIKDVKNAVKHLHGLGLVHNDITPANIMINENGRGVLIDFGSCKPEGHLVTERTPNFSNNSKVSKRENDFYSLDLCEDWLLEWKSTSCNIS